MPATRVRRVSLPGKDRFEDTQERERLAAHDRSLAASSERPAAPPWRSGRPSAAGGGRGTTGPPVRAGRHFRAHGTHADHRSMTLANLPALLPTAHGPGWNLDPSPTASGADQALHEVAREACPVGPV
jgi:hypothetical protein